MLFRSVKYSACIATIIAASSVADAGPAKPARRYEVTPIPMIDNPNCTPGFQHVTYTRRINATGQVIGHSECFEPTGFPEEPMVMGNAHGYLWSLEAGAQPMRALSPDAVGTHARGINDQGAVVGWETNDAGVKAPRWDEYGVGSYVLEPSFCAPFPYATADDINEANAVAARTYRLLPGSCRLQWVLVRPDGAQIIGSPTGQLSALNNHEVLVGSNGFNAVKWSPAIGEVTLGAPRTSNVERAHAFNLNDRNEAVGVVRRYDESGCQISSDAAAWSANGAERILPKLVGSNHADALGINESRLIVGRSYQVDTCNTFDRYLANAYAVIWRKDKVIDLNRRLSKQDRREIQLVSATSINEQGQIAAYGVYKNEEFAACWAFSEDPVTGEVFYDTSLRCPNVHAFLLTPVE